MASYADRTDLARVGVRADVTADVDPDELDDALAKRTSFANGYLSKRYTLPLTEWGDDLRLCVAQLAAWDVMSANVGVQPDQVGDTTWLSRFEQALAWLRDVAASRVDPDGIVDSSSPSRARVGPIAYSDEPRGY